MRAALQTGLRQIEMIDVEEPGLSDATAIVKVRAAGICGSDLHPYFGRSDRQPYVEGHEVAGEVVHLPRGYDGPIAVGDIVAVDTICLGCACGECHQCRAGYPFHCPERRGFRYNGAFAEAFERKPAGLFKLPPGMTIEQGALIEPLAVGVHAVRWARMPVGASVAVVGAGTIGLMTLLAARALGASSIDVIARHPHQANLARELGATAVHHLPPDGLEADYVFETVGGHGDSLEQAWNLARRQGTVVVLGIFPDKHPTDLLRPVIRELWATFPICYGSIDGRYDFDVAIDLVASGRAPVERLVTHRFGLEEAAEGFRVAADKSTGSVKVQLFP